MMISLVHFLKLQGGILKTNNGLEALKHEILKTLQSVLTALSDLTIAQFNAYVIIPLLGLLRHI